MNSARGLHLLADVQVHGKARAALADNDFVVAALEAAVQRMGMTVVGRSQHAFAPQGLTVCLLLAESHLCIHTWPETGVAALDLYVCNHTRDNSAAASAGFDWLCRYLGAQEIDDQRIERGNRAFTAA